MRRVSWSDADLVAAVAAARSWSAVLRHLKLTPNSRGSMRAAQRRAGELGLQTAHFTGRRRWTDAVLRDVVPKARSWNELFDMLGLESRSANSRVAVKANAHRLGLSLAHLNPPDRLPTVPLLAIPTDLNQLRKAAPSIAMAWFLLRGQPVSVPVEPVGYDFVAATSEGFKTVQVKTCVRIDESTGGYLVAIAPRRNHGADRGRLVPYDPDEVDLLFIVDGGGGMYLIPMTVVAGRTSLSLNAYADYRCGGAASLLRTVDAGAASGAPG